MKIRYQARIAYLAVIAGSVFSVVTIAGQSVAQPKKPIVTGTYSSLAYNEAGGDLLGQEIRIVYAAGGYEGTLQIAEGEPSHLIVVKIEVSGAKVSFVIPESSQYGGKFSGAVDEQSLTGEFQFTSGGNEKVRLRRGKSYWDR
jgi:hypothetical protein